MTNYFRNSVKHDKYVALGKKIIVKGIIGAAIISGIYFVGLGVYRGWDILIKQEVKAKEVRAKKEDLVKKVMNIAAGEDKLHSVKEGLKLARKLGYEGIILESSNPIHLKRYGNSKYRLAGTTQFDKNSNLYFYVNEEMINNYISEHSTNTLTAQVSQENSRQGEN